MNEETNEIESEVQRRGNTPARSGTQNPRTLRSADLLGNTQEMIIEHGGDQYRLRCTSKGKLILTK